jgi:opacity protein-like surface antigen
LDRLLVTLLGAALACAVPVAAHAQRVPGLPLSLEVRGGAALPTGELTDETPGIGAEAGPHFQVLAGWRFARGITAQVGYSRSWFGCRSCEAVDIDDRVVDAGFDAGLEIPLPVSLAGATPWVSAGGIYHQLVFSGEGSSLSSDRAFGFRVGAGAAVPLGRSLAVKPGISYSAYSAELELGAFPDEAVDVTHLTLDVGLVYHF